MYSQYYRIQTGHMGHARASQTSINFSSAEEGNNLESRHETSSTLRLYSDSSSQGWNEKSIIID